MHKASLLNISPFRAAIFDLDGVVTDTARLHGLAWKEMFEDYLQQPFSLQEDYLTYLDGKPRLEGVEHFLRSRGVEPDEETIRSLGDCKNRRFHTLLKDQGPRVYATTCAMIEQLKTLGLQIACVSASKNCKAVLASAGLDELFPTVVDGVVAEELGLAGKPEPDTFLEAARELGVSAEECLVVEDAAAGVEAGRRGRFGLVIGIARSGQAALLRESGADVVVSDLGELELLREPRNAFEVSLEHPLFFLDFDGTLSPIAPRPHLAILPPETRSVLEALSTRATVVIISGRDLKDVQQRVGLDGIIYGGSHGFELAGPGGLSYEYEAALPILKVLDDGEAELHRSLAGVAGVLIERKRFALAVHYRLAASERLTEIERAVVAAQRPGLRLRRGKMILEFSPDLPREQAWDKGRAILWLMDRLGVDPNATTPVYVGDDTTDEDAFRVLIDRGVGIVVMEAQRPTLAPYRLSSPDSVREFLEHRVHG